MPMAPIQRAPIRGRCSSEIDSLGGNSMEWMFMPLKRYADFSGRSRRKEYWSWVLFQFLLGLGYWILIFAFAGAAVMSGDMNAMFAAGGAVLLISGLYGLLGLAFLIPGLAV